MCGICGEVTFDGRPVQAGDVRLMRDAIAHRGPDDAGLHCDGPVGLGHRRLSILDLSPNGRQPMQSADGRLTLVYNGEVYNFKELRRQLEGRGYAFASATDSEVVLNAVHCWGLDQAVSRFIGMFAFAIWDARDRRLVLCRDRAGVKPLYYHRSSRRVLFGSEIKAIAAHPDFRRELDPQGVAQFFVTGYSLGETTVFRDTTKVLPGHVVEIDETGRVTCRRYWSLDNIERGSFSGSFDDAAEAVLAVSEDAFRLRLVSDVPVGLFFSGGTDSTFLAAVLKRRVGADLLHVTLGFREASFDESPKARAAASQLDLQHEVCYLEPPAARDAYSSSSRSSTSRSATLRGSRRGFCPARCDDS
jgi:asparagine synthase (glutamine-hydrolysing)